MSDKEKKVTSEEVESEIVENEVTEEVSEVKESKKEKKSEKSKGPGFFEKLGTKLKKFWKTMKSELKKITWYSRQQTVLSTLLVLVVMGISAAVIGVLDVLFSMGLEGLANLF
jgi:preprotein translocase subunit SecE